MDGGKTYPHPYHPAPEQRGRERKGAYRYRIEQQGGNGTASGERRKEPRHQHGQGCTHQGDKLWALRLPHQRGGTARTAGRIPVQAEGQEQRKKGKIRRLQGHHRTATPYCAGSRIHPERRIRLQGTCGSLAGSLCLCRCHSWREQGGEPHNRTQEQTDDSAGERQEIHLSTRLSLLAAQTGKRFTLFRVYIYGEVK